MLFNSVQFVLFFIVVYGLYLMLRHRWQNRMLLVASCFFYAVWDWRFLSLIFILITTDYFCGLKIYESDSEKIKKRFLLLSIFVNLSILGFFKYFNFCAVNLAHLINLFGFSIHPHTLNIILPIGISFYTFKTMSYTIDAYTGKIEPTRNYLDYALFVIFFPLLLAGPIMRAGDLIPQISNPRKVDLRQFYAGLNLVFWGFFEKIFIADNLALIVNPVFNSAAPYNGAMVLIAAYAFAFQIFCDFDGYSNIARGLGRMMGFDIMINFNLPYFATNPRDFWNRWHISLSTWLRDYLYTPLAFVRRSWGNWSVIFALMVTFIFCGLWHGAAWTFVIWGLYYGLLLIVHRLLQPLFARLPSPRSMVLKRISLILRVLFFFHLTCLGWIFFRAQSLHQVFYMLQGLSNFILPVLTLRYYFLYMVFLLWLLIVMQIFQKTKKTLGVIHSWPLAVRLCIYCIMLYSIAAWGDKGKEFIYFQF
jgi:alginate O-acetyltransferase complex protein AlgI